MKIKLVTLALILYGSKIMAMNTGCSNHELFVALTDEYKLTGNIDTTKYLPISSDTARKIVESDAEECIIHNRIRDLVHSYSISLYIEKPSGKSFVIFEGGFNGLDIIGFGPINKKLNK